MKKIFTLAISHLVAIISFANNGDGMMNITTLGHRSMRIEVDGKCFNSPDNFVSLPCLQPGYHSVRVTRNDRFDQYNNGPYGSSEIVFSNNVFVKPGFEVNIVVNPWGRTTIEERCIDPQYRQNDGYGSYDRDDYYRENRGGRWRHSDHFDHGRHRGWEHGDRDDD